jgi:Transport and Golgi organisation 2
MCTVTIIPVEGGFRLSCNRDERRDRPVAQPPAVRPLKNRRAVFPMDPVGPGTWIGVNDKGLAAVLLNRTRGSTIPSHRRSRLSRGLVIPMLLDCVSLEAALEICNTPQIGSFDPFQLVAVRGSETAIVTFDGLTLDVNLAQLSRPLMFTSSSLGDAIVGPRRQLFERLFAGDRRTWPRAQSRFHRHQWRSRPAVSVLMERPDAKTVSRTVVDVGLRVIELRYLDLESNQGIAVRAA